MQWRQQRPHTSLVAALYARVCLVLYSMTSQLRLIWPPTQSQPGTFLMEVVGLIQKWCQRQIYETWFLLNTSSKNGGSVRTTPWCSKDFYCPYVFQVLTMKCTPACHKRSTCTSKVHALFHDDSINLQGTTTMSLRFNLPFCGRLDKRFEGLVLHEVVYFNCSKMIKRKTIQHNFSR